jgi:hypothetical protein
MAKMAISRTKVDMLFSFYFFCCVSWTLMAKRLIEEKPTANVVRTVLKLALSSRD